MVIPCVNTYKLASGSTHTYQYIYIWLYIGINQCLHVGGACALFIIYYNIKLLSMHKYIYVYISIY